MASAGTTGVDGVMDRIVKSLFLCFILLFALSVIAVLTIGAIIYIVYSHYSSFVYPSYQSLVLIGIGVVIFVIAFFGWCRAVEEVCCTIIILFGYLIIFMSIDLSGVVIDHLIRRFKDMLWHKLNATMKSKP